MLPILERLDINPGNWLTLTTSLTKAFKAAIGKELAVTDYTNHMHRKRRSGLNKVSAKPCLLNLQTTADLIKS
ncbi:hypothetical protein [Pseudoalteromonas sp. bablab_jr011]|uniref:hypothetical protein n=1 Tax=Pseudoalteromonas sp. bablab_jr011 TaxID=2755062 RepID=UPI0018F5595E|nr:hypothetical protein [Pseudoalteromonas sp. bablab_jr011]